MDIPYIHNGPTELTMESGCHSRTDQWNECLFWSNGIDNAFNLLSLFLPLLGILIRYYCKYYLYITCKWWQKPAAAGYGLRPACSKMVFKSPLDRQFKTTRSRGHSLLTILYENAQENVSYVDSLVCWNSSPFKLDIEKHCTRKFRNRCISWEKGRWSIGLLPLIRIHIPNKKCVVSHLSLLIRDIMLVGMSSLARYPLLTQ